MQTHLVVNLRGSTNRKKQRNSKELPGIPCSHELEPFLEAAVRDLVLNTIKCVHSAVLALSRLVLSFFFYPLSLSYVCQCRICACVAITQPEHDNHNNNEGC